MDKEILFNHFSKVIELLEQHYVVASKKEKLLSGLREKNSDDFKNIKYLSEFATFVTEMLMQLSGDKHLYIELFTDQEDGNFLEEDWLKKELESERTNNFGFTEVKVMPNNIGYMKITQFMNPDRGIDTAIAAMKMLENTDATIIDLRHNRGGYGELGEYILSYFFDDEPILLSTTHDMNIKDFQTFTHPFVVGKRKLNHPLYILINCKTGSAAEYFTYVLQAHEKAIIVGEPSAGAANRNTYYPLTDGIRLSISTGEPIVEITGSNWEGEGVIPNIKCAPEDALDKAIAHLQQSE
ncbi:S41 family peptidase [Bacillus sp. SCS-151]|uniref:S41 family peptidase n=1 Tax=Nanhaiella sioensis TaxID=3115293 RepID=UPI00397B04BB